MICGVDEIVMTKVDILDGFKEVKFFIDGKYHTFNGWTNSTGETLDDNLKIFLDSIGDKLNIPVTMISIGTGRTDIKHL
jgi:adenylosuccinate synthase